MSLLDPFSFLIVSVGLFAGVLVSGLTGFAFSAVAGAILLHVMPPVEAVPMMMACSTVTQAFSLVALRGTVGWRGSALLIAGGALGMLPALYLLYHVDAGIFRIGFVHFSLRMQPMDAVSPGSGLRRTLPGRLRQAIVGFGGGLIGGLTAMPGTLPVIWCDLRGMPRDQQRGFVQPYIVTMQLFALALMVSRNTISGDALVNVAVNLPALVAGAALGIVMFRRIDDAVISAPVLAVLLFGIAARRLAGVDVRRSTRRVRARALTPVTRQPPSPLRSSPCHDRKSRTADATESPNWVSPS